MKGTFTYPFTGGTDYDCTVSELTHRLDLDTLAAVDAEVDLLVVLRRSLFSISDPGSLKEKKAKVTPYTGATQRSVRITDVVEVQDGAALELTCEDLTK